jgi:early secretory antigenic target protein ESAT-6
MTDSGHILVTFGSIAEGAADVDAVANQIDQQLSDLRAYLAPLVATWEGTASIDYQALQRKWDTSLADLNVVLRQIGNSLRTANQNYTSAETTNARMWG